jgi:hypothetical protein
MWKMEKFKCCKSFFVIVVVVVIVNLMKIPPITCEMFTAVEHLTNNLLAESYIIKKLEYLINVEENRLVTLKQ